MLNVLIIDNNLKHLKDHSAMIEYLGYSCHPSSSFAEAFSNIQSIRPDVTIIDANMLFSFGFDNLSKIIEKVPESPVIIISERKTFEAAISALKLGAFSFIEMPIKASELEIKLKKAIAHRDMVQENRILKDHFNKVSDRQSYQIQDIIGKSVSLAKVLDRAMKIAPSDANVMIQGESGTGKELMARAIHKNSKRHNKPFIPLDCAALPPSLLESEIFGYEQGAFTGATKSKPGMIELAHKGTLFLDEVVELDVNLQAKLLRVIQERQFRRIGGVKLISVDIRIISATHWNLEHAVREKKLREDLYYRLNVVPIYLPPLRERKQDIPLLVDAFISRFALTTSKPVTAISKAALQILKRYHWPGNIRELQNIIEQMVVLTTNSVLDVEDIPDVILDNLAPHFDVSLHELDFKSAKQLYMNDFYQNYFKQLLRQCKGNISAAARKAKISRKNLYQIINNYDIRY